MALDWKAVSCQLIRALRHQVSQIGASRRLGFASNPVPEWEAGRRYPTAPQMFRLAEVMGLDIHAALRRFHEPSAAAIEQARHIDVESLSQWLRTLRGGTKIKTLQERCNLSRFSIARMLRAESSMRLPEFLELVHAMTLRIDDLVSELVDVEAVPALPIDYSRKALREVGLEYPWVHAVRRLMDTEEYQRLSVHEPGWFANRLRIAESLETKIINRMLETGVLTDESGRLVPHYPIVLYLGSKSDEAVRNKRHYTNVVEKRLADGIDPEDFVLSNVISVSKKDYDRVQELLHDTARELRAIVLGTEREEVAAVVGLHLVQWGLSSGGAGA